MERPTISTKRGRLGIAPGCIVLHLTFVFPRQHFVKREGHGVDLAGELEAAFLTLAAQGLQGHQQVTAGICRGKARGPHMTAITSPDKFPSA